MLYKVYALYAPVHDRIYVGLTTGLGEMMQSLNGNKTGSKLEELGPWTLIHMELFPTEDEASLRKAYLDSPEGMAYIRTDILALFDF